MKRKLETINVNLLMDGSNRPFGDVVIFREGGYYRAYDFHPRIPGGISTYSMRRCQRIQEKIMLAAVQS